MGICRKSSWRAAGCGGPCSLRRPHQRCIAVSATAHNGGRQTNGRTDERTDGREGDRIFRSSRRNYFRHAIASVRPSVVTSRSPLNERCLVSPVCTPHDAQFPAECRQSCDFSFQNIKFARSCVQVCIDVVKLSSVKSRFGATQLGFPLEYRVLTFVRSSKCKMACSTVATWGFSVRQCHRSAVINLSSTNTRWRLKSCGN